MSSLTCRCFFFVTHTCQTKAAHPDIGVFLNISSWLCRISWLMTVLLVWVVLFAMLVCPIAHSPFCICQYVPCRLRGIHTHTLTHTHTRTAKRWSFWAHAEPLGPFESSWMYTFNIILVLEARFSLILDGLKCFTCILKFRFCSDDYCFYLIVYLKLWLLWLLNWLILWFNLFLSVVSVVAFFRYMVWFY